VIHIIWYSFPPPDIAPESVPKVSQNGQETVHGRRSGKHNMMVRKETSEGEQVQQTIPILNRGARGRRGRTIAKYNRRYEIERPK